MRKHIHDNSDKSFLLSEETYSDDDDVENEFVELQPLHDVNCITSDSDESIDEFSRAKVPGLKRHISFFSASALLLGTIIGSGIFASPRNVFEHANSAGAALLIWALCGVLALCCSLVWIELGTMFPNNGGGEYTYIYKAFGPLPAFVFILARVAITGPAGLTLVVITCGDYVIVAVGCDHKYSKMVAAVVIAVILIVNCLSVKWATVMQVAFTAAKMIAIVILIITGLVRLGQGHNDNFKNAFNGTNAGISDIGYAFYGGLWAYDGWNNLNYVTEELKNPIRDLPLAIMIGIPLVTACYVLVNIAYLTVMTSAQIAQSNAVAVTLGYDLYGKMAWIIPVLVACSTFGAANGSAFTSGRLVYVSAREGHMPRLLAMVHKKRHTPLPALIFTCVIAWIMLIPESSNFSTLVNYFNFAAWTFYGATIAALLWLRYKEPDLKRPYKVFIGIPIFVLLCSIYLVVAPFYDYPRQSVYCLLFILLGIPMYFAFVKYQIFPQAVYAGFDSMTSKIELWCNLALPETEGEEVDEIMEAKQKQAEVEENEKL